MADLTSIVPAPGVKLKLVEVHVPRIINTPPLAISNELPAKEALTLLTFKRFVPPATQLRVRAAVLPIVNVPYATLSVPTLLSTIHVPFIMRLSPAIGKVPPFHLAASLKLPVPVNVFVAAKILTLMAENKKRKIKKDGNSLAIVVILDKEVEMALRTRIKGFIDGQVSGDGLICCNHLIKNYLKTQID